MQTAFTRLLGVRVPVILAPMAGASGGLLAAAVHAGGGLGMIAAGHSPLSQLRLEIALGRKQLGITEQEPLPLGIGIILWKFEAPHGDPQQTAAFLDCILSARPRAIWLSFGVEGGMSGWVDRIRKMEDERSQARALLFLMVPSVGDAIEAAKLGADVVVAQGVEAGGHGPSYESGLPLLSLLPAIKAAYRSLKDPPILAAAGGISNGAQVVSVLPFAEAAVCGTAFLATPESLYNDNQKELIINTDGSKTLRTMNFDLARNTLGWGVGVDGRGIANSTSTSSESDVGSAAGQEKYNEAVKAQDVTRIVTWSGTSVGEVTSHQGAEAVVRKLEKEAIDALDHLRRMCSHD
ncbi:hypothetical protein RQP46_000730 [Phenoliferia psychrophenolica]